jgi:hypothetical protein
LRRLARRPPAQNYDVLLLGRIVSALFSGVFGPSARSRGRRWLGEIMTGSITDAGDLRRCDRVLRPQAAASWVIR